MRTRHVVALLLVMGAGCGPQLMDVGPGGEDSGGPPDAGPCDGLELNSGAAAQYSASTGGVAVVVTCDNAVVFEKYEGGKDATTATHLHSGTKGFWGVVVAKLIEQGLLQGYDQKVSDILVEWKGTNKENITFRQAMQLASGLENDIPELQGDNPSAPDLYEHAIKNVNVVRAPGTFSYGPVNFYVLGAVIERLLQAQGGKAVTPLDYLREQFFEPIGVEYADWMFDVSGNPHIPNGAFMTPRNWVKWGHFLMNRGAWNGEQLVSKQLVDELFEPASANPGYGLFIWLNTQEGFGASTSMKAPPGSPGGFIYHDGYTELFGTLGAGKNRLYILPSKHLVIARQTFNGNDTFEDHAFLSALFSPQ